MLNRQGGSLSASWDVAGFERLSTQSPVRSIRSLAGHAPLSTSGPSALRRQLW